jgi:hypothetical protein
MTHLSEIFFNPFRYWFTRGPLTKLFRQFLWSPIPVQVKWSILAYMASYYAFAIACPIVLLNFALVGLLEKRDTFCTSYGNNRLILQTSLAGASSSFVFCYSLALAM